jgi:hypothetical protein
MGFYVGQKVIGALGEGVVTRVLENSTYPIVVEHTEGSDVYHSAYCKDGREFLNHKGPSLYPLEKAPELPSYEKRFKKGEWCWFWNKRKIPTIRRFDRVNALTLKYYDEFGMWWDNCAPFDKDNMTPPWERGAQG